MRSWNSKTEGTTEKKRKQYINSINPLELVDNFPLYITRQELGRYLVRYELYKKVMTIKGSIIECGVYKGASLLFFAKLCSIFEPYAFNRKVIGFDTFSGFPRIAKKDGTFAYKGDLRDVDLRKLMTSIDLYDKNRPIGHIGKIELIKGDATKTIPEYFKTNPHCLVALLYLDFDLYEPTVTALQTIVSRMPKGSLLVFDELNEKRRQGETIALLETIDLAKHSIRNFPEEPHISYIEL